MKAFCSIAVLLAASAASAQKPAAEPAVPFRDESLHYTVNWPSGLSLGEAQMQASRKDAQWSFAFSLDAAVPGFAASDTYSSVAAGDFCSTELNKRFTHGKRRGDETTTFDAQAGKAVRQTLKGGQSEVQIPACPRDALSFLYYVRRELADGRLPGPQTVYFGAPYQVRLEFGGRERVNVNDRPENAERIVASLKGPASQTTVELFFALDRARTPLVVRVPLAAGKFTMELVR
ncbi:MAG: DUF3108 domain-containing protein [Acidobacteriota bacterium]